MSTRLESDGPISCDLQILQCALCKGSKGPSVKQGLDPPEVGSPERMHQCACQQEDWAAETIQAASGQAVATGSYPALSGHARPQEFEAFARQPRELEDRCYSLTQKEVVAKLRALCHAGDWQGAVSLETPALAVARDLQNAWPEVSDSYHVPDIRTTWRERLEVSQEALLHCDYFSKILHAPADCCTAF